MSDPETDPTPEELNKLPTLPDWDDQWDYFQYEDDDWTWTDPADNPFTR